jgi:surface-anchored protein
MTTRLVSLTFLSATLATLPLANAAGLYTEGHGDVRAYYQDGQLKLRYQLDYGGIVDGNEVGSYDEMTGPVPASFGLDQLIVSIPETSLAQSPDNRFDFTGAGVGENLWFIPEGADYSLPWLGFSTTELDQNEWAGETLGELNFGFLQMELLSVSGPAGSHFSLFYNPQDEFSAPLVHFATSDGIDANDVFKGESVHGGTTPQLSVGTHIHSNWMFTQPGIYDVTLKFSGEHLVDGYKEVSGTVRFEVASIPEPNTIILMSIGMIALLGVARKRLDR